METQTSNYIFVYGTLRSDVGSKNELGVNIGKDMRKACTFVGKATIEGELFDAGDFPCLIQGNSTNVVHGELYEIYDKGIIQQLDWFESNGNLYNRVVYPVICEGVEYKAWVYFYMRDITDMVEVESGDYLEHLNNA